MNADAETATARAATPAAPVAAPTPSVDGDGSDGSGGHGGHAAAGVGGLAFVALGVVYGDIGTSPLYALRETFNGHGHELTVNATNVYGLLSLILWSLIIIISIKYITFVMRVDNGGEGGILALLALLRPTNEPTRGPTMGSPPARAAGNRPPLRRCRHHTGHLGAVRGRGRGSSPRRGWSDGSCPSPS